jgi:tRNA pseudouridine55 synthase
MNGKRLYEYAREGKPLPVEIKARPVSTVSLELTDFTFEHDYTFPEEAPQEEKVTVAALEKQLDSETAAAAAAEEVVGEKRQRSVEAEVEAQDENVPKKMKADEVADVASESAVPAEAPAEAPAETPAAPTKPEGKPCVVTLRMTVTSGFYVRSLIHDLGKALGSEAHMVKLVRTRQSDFEIGTESVLEWDELMEKPEEVWGPKVESMLRKWAEENQRK